MHPHVDSVDIVFGLFFPPIGAFIVYAGAYGAALAAAGGRPLARVTKEILRIGSFLVLGIGYVISLTGFLGLSPQTLWITLPLWALLFAVLVRWRYKNNRGGDPKN